VGKFTSAKLGKTWAALTGVREGPTTAEQRRVKELEREVRELRRANEILKLASAFFAQAELDRRLKS
jgi:transposase-like protein